MPQNDLQIVSFSSQEAIDLYGTGLNTLMSEHGGPLAEEYREGEVYTDTIPAQQEDGYRGINTLILALRDGQLVGFLEPTMYSLDEESKLPQIPPNLQDTARGILPTVLNLGPLVVETNHRNKGVATALLEHCYGVVFPDTVRAMRENITGAMIPEDREKFGDQAPQIVQQSLQTPLALIESSSPKLNDIILRILADLPDLYVTDHSKLTEAEAAIVQTLVSPYLGGNLEKIREGTRSKEIVFFIQQRLGKQNPLDPAVDNITTLTMPFKLNVYNEIAQIIRSLGATITSNKKHELRYLFNDTSTDLQQIIDAVLSYTPKTGINPHRFEETTYRHVVGTRF